MTKTPAYVIGMLLSFLCVSGVYYWEYRYYFAEGEPGINEFLIGSALIIIYTWPVWLGFPALVILFRTSFQLTHILLASMPAVIIVLPTLARSLGGAIN